MKTTAHDYERSDAGPIPQDALVGIEWKDDDGETIRTFMPTLLNGKRRVDLRLNSYVGGTAIGAMHYYASLQVECVRCMRPDDPDSGCFGGYMGKAAPNLGRIILEAQRPIKRGEKDANGDSIGKAGQSTNRFNTKAEAKAAGIALFKARFGPGFVLILDDWVDDDPDNQKPIAET